MSEKRLIIIGNGFDIAHGLKTRYSDFREYMLRNKSATLTNTFKATNKYFSCGTKELINVLFNIIDISCKDNEWNDFEEALGNIDYREILKKYHHLGNSDEEISLIIQNNFRWLEGNLEEWISELDYSTFYRKFTFTDDDVFLSFNYTKTLEDKYNIKECNICHIHGSIDFNNRKIYEDELILGHNKGIAEIDFCNNNNFKTMAQLLKKDKTRYKERYNNFLNNIRKQNVSKVIDFGFSYADVDMSYIKELIENIDSNKTKWFTNVHNCNIKTRMTTLKELGFNGEILITDSI